MKAKCNCKEQLGLENVTSTQLSVIIHSFPGFHPCLIHSVLGIAVYHLFYYYIMHACSVILVMSDSLQPHGLELTRLLCPWDSPGKNIGVDGVLVPPPWDLPDPGIKPVSPPSPSLAGKFFNY